MKKVILFHPKTDHEKFYKFYWIPYSVLNIGSSCIAAGYEPIIIDENAGEIFKQKELELIIKSSFCLGISCMTGNQIKNGLVFAKLARTINSNIVIGYIRLSPKYFIQIGILK